MTALEKNLKHYMSIKSIKNYMMLLKKIGDYLGQDGYDFAKRNKSNFSKMLKENNPRRFNFSYIVPIEKILGVSYARLLEEDSYKLPIDKKDIMFNKGFRYYAYKDDPKLYEKELAKLTTKRGESILTQTDEFDKTFLDYVVEYNAINGIRFLHDCYHLKLRRWNNQFDTEPFGLFLATDKAIPLARMVANMNDEQLFNDIYDPYYTFAHNGYYLDETIFAQDDYLEILLDNQILFDSLFKEKEYVFSLGRRAQITRGTDKASFKIVNPVINGCLNYVLNHLDKYKDKAIQILKFGIKHNEEIKVKLNEPYLTINELGGILNRNYDVVDLVIFVNNPNIQDKEILNLVQRLPKFNTYQ